MTGFTIEKDDGTRIEVSEEVFMQYSLLASNMKSKLKTITSCFADYAMEKEGFIDRDKALDFVAEKVGITIPKYLSDFVIGKKS